MNPRELARRVLELRLWQHLINEEMKRGRFRIPIHAAFGHEALAVALDAALAPADQLALTHRNMAYQFARASTLTENAPSGAIFLCALALRFTQMRSVGGLSETEHTAVAVSPVLSPGLPTAMTVTAPACWRMSVR